MSATATHELYISVMFLAKLLVPAWLVVVAVVLVVGVITRDGR